MLGLMRSVEDAEKALRAFGAPVIGKTA